MICPWCAKKQPERAKLPSARQILRLAVFTFSIRTDGSHMLDMFSSYHETHFTCTNICNRAQRSDDTTRWNSFSRTKTNETHVRGKAVGKSRETSDGRGERDGKENKYVYQIWFLASCSRVGVAVAVAPSKSRLRLDASHHSHMTECRSSALHAKTSSYTETRIP